MLSFNQIDFQRIGLATIGAIILTTTAVGAAVGPAYAVKADRIVTAQLSVADEARG